jgi:hypothetical protein
VGIVDANYVPIYQPNELFIVPRTEETVPMGKLTWMEEFKNGTKIYFKVRVKTSNLEGDTKPDDVVRFSIEFKKGF